MSKPLEFKLGNGVVLLPINEYNHLTIRSNLYDSKYERIITIVHNVVDDELDDLHYLDKETREVVIEHINNLNKNLENALKGEVSLKNSLNR